MKDVQEYPRTLRNYDENNNPKNGKKLGLNEKTNPLRKNVYLSTFYQKENTHEQDHLVTDYNTITNVSEINNKKAKKSKAKSKTKSKESYLSNALKKSLSKKAVTFQQVGPQNIVHCKSLEKLQIISNDRSEEIKILINEKALLIAENEELKAKLSNPTYREQEYIQKIVTKDIEIENLKETLKRRDERIAEIEKEHRLEIERMKKSFQEQLATIKGGVSPIVQYGPEKKRESEKVYYTDISTNEVNPVRQVVQPASYEIHPKTVNTIGSGIYKISHSNNDYRTIQSQSSTSGNQEKKSYEPQKETIITTNSPSNQQFKTYIGEDGYERRVYYRSNSKELPEKYHGEPERIKISAPYQEGNEIIHKNLGSPNVSSGNRTFTNAKISSHMGKEPQQLPIYNYTSRENEESDKKSESKLHNENLYSQSLTFQCFNDQRS